MYSHPVVFVISQTYVYPNSAYINHQTYGFEEISRCCDDTPYTMILYKTSTGTGTWDRVYDWCLSQGYELISVYNEDIQDKISHWLNSLIGTPNLLWTSGRAIDDDTWKYLNKETFDGLLSYWLIVEFQKVIAAVIIVDVIIINLSKVLPLIDNIIDMG